MAPKSKRQKTQSSFSVEKADHEKFVQALISSTKYGKSYCEALGIDLQPGDSDSLYKWLGCSLMFSSGLSEKLTTRAAKLLLDAGLLDSPATTKQAAVEKFVGLLDHKYQRKEQTAKYMHSSAQVLLDKYEGSLYKLREAAKEKPDAERKKIQEIKGLAKVGIDIFFREAQCVWPELVPFVDGRASSAAKKLGLPSSAADLYSLVGEDVRKLARLAAALVRIDLAKAEGLEDAQKLLAGEAVHAEEDDEEQDSKPAPSKKEAAAAEQPQEGSKPAEAAESNDGGAHGKAAAAQDALEPKEESKGETQANDEAAGPAGNTGEGPEADVEHTAGDSAAAGEVGDM